MNANNSNPLSLIGRHALITGGASGIGKAAAQLYVELGARVVIADIDDALLSSALEQTGALSAIHCDVSDEQAVMRAVDQTLSILGGLDTVLHCAGVAHVTAALDQDLASWQRVMDINVKGTHLVCCAAAKHMIKHGGGSITTISSIAGQRGFPRRGAYGTSKAAVAHMTRTFACEWGKGGVRVNAIAPGYIETPMVKQLADKGLLDLRRLEGRTPLGRLGVPDEIARTAAFLASDWASFITGSELYVDGGWGAFSGSGEVDTF